METASPPSAVSEPSRCLALVLGGGGGRGGAHLGVLATLNALELPIDRIVGTSIGGLIGVLYAAGYSVEAITAMLDGQTWRDLISRDPAWRALFGNEHLRTLLTAWVGTRTFADLAIPTAVIAVDLVSGQAVVLDEGSLVEALLATTALPGLFPPLEREGMLLADGGILNNVPVDVAIARGADRVIAVDLIAVSDGFALTADSDTRFQRYYHPLLIAQRALTLLTAALTRYHLSETYPDLLIRPAVAHIGTLDLHQIAAGAAIGAAAAQAVSSDLLALRAWRVPHPVAPPVPEDQRTSAAMSATGIR